MICYRIGAIRQSSLVKVHLRARPRISIDTRPVDEAQGVGLGVPAGGGVVVAVPVVREAGLDEEDLAGEAQVVLDGAGEAVGLAEGIVEGLPDGGSRGVGHADGAAQVIGVHHREDRARRVDGGD